ncbi:MAG: SCP2 sterol-binding domain-containing protein [Candidatus Adiutrix sp.]
MNSSELFDILQKKVAALHLDDSVTTTISFELTGEEGVLWGGRIEGGRAFLCPTPIENAQITIISSIETAVGILQKTINPMGAFLMGKIKIKGDISQIAILKNLVMGAKK